MLIGAHIIELIDRVHDGTLKQLFLEVFRSIESIYKKEMVTKSEFNELKDIVKELAEAQKKTEQKINSLSDRVNELAKAQMKTEQRFNSLTDRVNELAEAQKKTEQRLNELAEAQKKTEQRLNELAEAQKKTEQRLNELAEAQKKTEQKLNELAEAQKKTEQELTKLIGEHKKTREQLGGLSHTVGYVLEDNAYKGLPRLLKKDFGLDVKWLKRDYVETPSGRYEELNIIGEATKNGDRVWILGECKTQLKKRNIDNFLKKVERVESSFPGEKIFVLVTYQAPPQVRNYIKQKGIKLYFSYEL